MQHVLTVETHALARCLGRVRRRHRDRHGVFTADLVDPIGRFVLVELTRADLAKSHRHEIEMAGFQGGKKTGPLKELCTALDYLDGVRSTTACSA